MHSLKRLPAALIVALMTASCASSATHGIAPLPLLPAEYAIRCPDPVMPASNQADDMAMALKDMYDLYGICAGRLIDVVDWIMKPGK